MSVLSGSLLSYQKQARRSSATLLCMGQRIVPENIHPRFVFLQQAWESLEVE